MTVEQHNDYDEVECQWFAGKKLEHGRFPANSLIRVNINEE